MPKLKTNRGAAKRFKRTANNLKCKHSHHNHILTKKSTHRKRKLRETTLVNPSDKRQIVRLLRGA